MASFFGEVVTGSYRLENALKAQDFSALCTSCKFDTISRPFFQDSLMTRTRTWWSPSRTMTLCWPGRLSAISVTDGCALWQCDIDIEMEGSCERKVLPVSIHMISVTGQHRGRGSCFCGGWSCLGFQPHALGGWWGRAVGGDCDQGGGEGGGRGGAKKYKIEGNTEIQNHRWLGGHLVQLWCWWRDM